jgi:hypothetical protein
MELAKLAKCLLAAEPEKRWALLVHSFFPYFKSASCSGHFVEASFPASELGAGSSALITRLFVSPACTGSFVREGNDTLVEGSSRGMHGSIDPVVLCNVSAGSQESGFWQEAA